jgi:hypothetical protein
LHESDSTDLSKLNSQGKRIIPIRGNHSSINYPCDFPDSRRQGARRIGTTLLPAEDRTEWPREATTKTTWLKISKAKADTTDVHRQPVMGL